LEEKMGAALGPSHLLSFEKSLTQKKRKGEADLKLAELRWSGTSVELANRSEH
jgi:hypothetical protein